MCGACYLEPNPNPFSTGIKSQKTIDLFRKKAQIVCTKHLFRHQFVLCLFVCRYMTNSPQVPFQEPKGWPFSARCVAWTNSTRGPVANKAVLGIAPGLWTWDDLTHTLAKGLQKYRTNTKISIHHFSRHVLFSGRISLYESVRMKAACTPMHFCQKSHAMPRVKRHQQAQRCHQGSCHGTSR